MYLKDLLQFQQGIADVRTFACQHRPSDGIGQTRTISSGHARTITGSRASMRWLAWSEAVKSRIQYPGSSLDA